MKKKIITFFLVIFLVCLTYVNYNLITSYYNSDYYKVEITSNGEDIIFVDQSMMSTSIDIYIKNNSRKILSSDNNIFLSYHLFDADGNVITYDNPRIDISTINPYSTGKYVMDIIRPDKLGDYMIEIDLVEENVAWFKEKGNETLILKLIGDK